MNLEDFCKEIGLPKEMMEKTLEFSRSYDFRCLEPQTAGLFRREAWDASLEALKKALEPDGDGRKMLAVMLLCCGKTWALYQARGLSREIFRDTMGCFSRFVRECRVHRGYWGFDRAFWTPRQLSMELLRIGTLEYELLHTAEGPEVALHIPSDSLLTRENLHSSFTEAVEIIAKAFPLWQAAPFTCESWLLSPELPALLPKSSRILEFQSYFHITGQAESEDYREWVFRDSHSPVENLPESTTLQKNLKAFLLSGGVFHNGSGQAVAGPFVHARTGGL